jgi:hypothetical protein
MHNLVYKFVLSDYLSEEGVQRAVRFLDAAKLSPNGEAVIVSVIIYAKGKKKTLNEIFAVCNRERDATWMSQDSAIRGDPDAAGDVGEQNRASLQIICHFLGIPNPSDQNNKVSKDSLVVRTIEGVVYRFGSANERDERTLTIDGKIPPSSNMCKIVFLSSGRKMVLLALNPDFVLHTSEVEVISFI